MFPESIIDYIDGIRYNYDMVGQSKADVFMFENGLVLKTEKKSVESDNEIVMYKWLEDKLPMPKILEIGYSNKRNYILMEAVKGLNIYNFKYKNNERILIDILVNALNLLWKIDISDCPKSITLDKKLSLARHQIDEKLVDMDNWDSIKDDIGFDTPEELLTYLNENKPTEDGLVFSHGDFSFANLFYIGESFSSFIDLGRAGIADKYQDIALCYRGIKDLFDEFHINLFFEKLNFKPDYDKINYYILMDELF